MMPSSSRISEMNKSYQYNGEGGSKSKSSSLTEFILTPQNITFHMFHKHNLVTPIKYAFYDKSCMLVLAAQYGPCVSTPVKTFYWSRLRFLTLEPGAQSFYSSRFAFDVRLLNCDIHKKGAVNWIQSNNAQSLVALGLKAKDSNYCYIFKVPEGPQGEDVYVESLEIELDLFVNGYGQVEWLSDAHLMILTHEQILIIELDGTEKYIEKRFLYLIDTPIPCMHVVLEPTFEYRLSQPSPAMKLLGVSMSGKLYGLYITETFTIHGKIGTPKAKAKANYKDISYDMALDVSAGSIHDNSILTKFSCEDPVQQTFRHFSADAIELMTICSEEECKITSFVLIQSSPFVLFGVLTYEGQLTVFALDRPLNAVFEDSFFFSLVSRNHIHKMDTIQLPPSPQFYPSFTAFSISRKTVPNIIVQTPKECFLIEFPWIEQLQHYSQFCYSLLPCLIQTTTQHIFKVEDEKNFVLGFSYFTDDFSQALVLVLMPENQKNINFSLNDTKKSNIYDILVNQNDNREYKISACSINLKEAMCTTKQIREYEQLNQSLWSMTASTDGKEKNSITTVDSIYDQLNYMSSLFNDLSLLDILYTELNPLVSDVNGTYKNTHEALLNALNEAHEKLKRLQKQHQAFQLLHTGLENFKIQSTLVDVHYKNKQLYSSLNRIQDRIVQVEKTHDLFIFQLKDVFKKLWIRVLHLRINELLHTILRLYPNALTCFPAILSQSINAKALRRTTSNKVISQFVISSSPHDMSHVKPLVEQRVQQLINGLVDAFDLFEVTRNVISKDHVQ